jgi:hypothetical protein
MFINNILYTIVTILLPLLLWLGLSIFVKKKFNSYYGVFFGLILSAFGFGALQGLAVKVYLIEENQKISVYRTLGAISYQFDNQTQLVDSFQLQGSPTGIINNTKDSLVLQEIIYGSKGYYKNKPEWKELVGKIDSNYIASHAPKSYLIPPYSYQEELIPFQTIDFFFEDKIPETLEGYGNRGITKKYWLHK